MYYIKSTDIFVDMNKAAGDIIHPPPKVNSLQALIRLRPRHGHEWCVFAFVLNRDMIKKDGTLDDLYGMIFMLGSFDNQDAADAHAKNIMALTKHPGIMVSRYAYPFRLSPTFDPSAVSEVSFDTKGKLMELESAQYKHEREEYEKRLKIERDIMKEAEEETDPDNIEYFKRQCYLAIKNRSNHLNHVKEAEATWKNYKMRQNLVSAHYNKHPEHDKLWLPYLKEKLIERGEMQLYKGLKNSYINLREELLGINPPKDITIYDLKEKVIEKNNIIDELTNKLSEQNAIIEALKRKIAGDSIKCECGDICLGLKNKDQVKMSDVVLDHIKMPDIVLDTCTTSPNDSNMINPLIDELSEDHDIIDAITDVKIITDKVATDKLITDKLIVPAMKDISGSSVEDSADNYAFSTEDDEEEATPSVSGEK